MIVEKGMTQSSGVRFSRDRHYRTRHLFGLLFIGRFMYAILTSFVVTVVHLLEA